MNTVHIVFIEVDRGRADLNTEVHQVYSELSHAEQAAAQVDGWVVSFPVRESL